MRWDKVLFWWLWFVAVPAAAQEAPPRATHFASGATVVEAVVERVWDTHKKPSPDYWRGAYDLQRHAKLRATKTIVGWLDRPLPTYTWYPHECDGNVLDCVPAFVVKPGDQVMVAVEESPDHADRIRRSRMSEWRFGQSAHLLVVEPILAGNDLADALEQYQVRAFQPR